MSENPHLSRRAILAGLGSSAAIALPDAGNVFGQNPSVEAGILPRFIGLSDGIDALWKRTIETGHEHVQMYAEHTSGEPPTEWLPANVSNRGERSLNVQHDLRPLQGRERSRYLFDIHTHPPGTLQKLVESNKDSDSRLLMPQEIADLRAYLSQPAIAPLSSIDLLQKDSILKSAPRTVQVPRALYGAAKVETGLYVFRPATLKEIEALAPSFRLTPEETGRARMEVVHTDTLHFTRDTLADITNQLTANECARLITMLREWDRSSPYAQLFARTEIQKKLRSFLPESLNDQRRQEQSRDIIFDFLLLLAQYLFRDQEIPILKSLTTRLNPALWDNFVAHAKQLREHKLYARFEQSEKYDRAVVRIQYEARAFRGNDDHFWRANPESVRRLRGAALAIGVYMYFIPNASVKDKAALLK